MPDAVPLVATILPPLEGFGPDRAGAVGLVAHDLARVPGFRCVVFGGPQAAPFPGIDYRAVRPAWWFPGNINLRFGAALLRPLHRLRPALIEVHNRPELARFLARALPRSRVVLFLHNDPQGMRGLRTPAGRAGTLRRLERVVVVSDWLRRRLLEGVGAVPRPPAVLPNGIDLGSLPPAVEREHLILFVGRVVRDKAPDAFVEACAAVLPQLPGWRAQMIGADRFGAGSPETRFMQEVRAAAQAADVRLTGYQGRAAVLRAMARAAIVVAPSRWQEPFGLVALEALASGAALVCSARGGLPEVAGDAAVYVDPDEPGALAAAILGLARDLGRRAALAEAGRARARQFDAPVIAAQLSALRQEMLG